MAAAVTRLALAKDAPAAPSPKPPPDTTPLPADAPSSKPSLDTIDAAPAPSTQPPAPDTPPPPADAPSTQTPFGPTPTPADTSAGVLQIKQPPSSSEGDASSGSASSSKDEVDWTEPLDWQKLTGPMRDYLDRVDQKTKRVVQLLIHYGYEVKHLYPNTHEEYASLKKKIERLLADGQHFQALPMQSLAVYACFVCWGPDSTQALTALYDVVLNLHQRGHAQPLFYEYILPLAIKEWGVNNPDTRKLVHQAATHAYKLGDPRQHPHFTRIVLESAQQLPGGLGWGKVELGAVPDVDAYNRHCVMQRKAEELMSKREYKLAQVMAERCVKFYETLGMHWLALPRRITCTQLLGGCALYLDTAAAAEPFLVKAKRMAQQQLGHNHEIALESMWQFALILMAQNRLEQALSMCSKALRLRKEVLGPRHSQVIENQWSVGQLLQRMNKLHEAEAMYRDTFETAVKVEGPEGRTTRQCLISHWCVLHVHMDRPDDAALIIYRAAALGVDVSTLVTDIEEEEEEDGEGNQQGQPAQG